MSNDKYHITQVSEDAHLMQILSLQRANLKNTLTKDEIRKEGFVTCEHSLELLSKMNVPLPHIIAIYNNRVVGYCLVMSSKWKNELKILQSMFVKIDSVTWKDKPLGHDDFIIMGQVCIDSKHRGKGLFRKMYEHFKLNLSATYKYCITEIDANNTRSFNAHAAVGFETLLNYHADDGNDWELVIWDW